MVGVPGRSRACATCKGRRIKCDVQGPPCGPCVQARRVCTFPQKHIFILNDHGGHRAIYRKRASLAPVACDQSEASPDHVSKIEETSRSRKMTTPLVRPFGTLTALKQQLLVEACTESPNVDQPYRGRPWTLALVAFADFPYALNSAPLACYTSWLGRRNRDPYLVEASRKLYVAGLREVQDAVNRESTSLRDETFAACMALSMYEALECPDRSQRGLDVHTDGCSKLVKLRGASMHQEGAAHELFRAFRYMNIIRAFETHCPTFLSSNAWITLPWRTRPKSSWDRLLDLLTEGPIYFEKADRLATTPPQLLLPALLEMIEELLALENRMQAFFVSLSSSYPTQLFWESNSHVSDLDQTHTLMSPSSLEFHDLEVARILTLYWAVLSIVLSGLNDLWGAAQALMSNNTLGTKFNHVYRSLLIEPRDWLDPIRQVCRSIDYCNSENSQGLGPILIAVPLDIVLDVMKTRSGCATEYQKAVSARQDISRNYLRVLEFTAQSSAKPRED